MLDVLLLPACDVVMKSGLLRFSPSVAPLTVFSVAPLVQAVTINYHHATGSRAPSLDDDEEEEDRLHAMISMICSRNLTDPNVMKGFYHLNTPTHP